jgi:hypothetical protein
MRKEESNNGSKNWRGNVVFHYEILVTRLWLIILFCQSLVVNHVTQGRTRRGSRIICARDQYFYAVVQPHDNVI